MNVKSIALTAVLGGTIALSALIGGTGQSQAAGFKGLSGMNAAVAQSEVQKVHLRRRHLRIHRFRSLDDGCGFYKWKWYETGYFYWKKRYYICKGWW